MAATYNVTSIEPTVILGAGNRPERGQLIAFETVPSKIVGELRISDTEATPEIVADRLADRAARLEAIKGL